MTGFRTIFFLLACLIAFLFSQSSDAEEGIVFGVKPEKGTMVKKGYNSKNRNYLIVHFEHGYGLLYKDTKSNILYLSLFKNGKEKILWQKKHGGSVTSSQAPSPNISCNENKFK